MENVAIKILLIEDNPDDQELLQRKLGKSANGRLTVTAVKSLHDAIEHLAQNKPDIILSDLGLPDSHGLDTVTKIMCEAPNIPLVVLTGLDDEATALKAVQAGAQDYLVKGQLEGRQLERSLFYAIERTQLQTELEQHTQEISKIQGNLLKILDKNADAIIIVAGQDKKILFTNPAAASLLDQRKKDLINTPFLFPLDGGKTSEIEISHRVKGTITAEMNVVEIDWEGQPAYLASLRNITRRKKMEEALRVSEEKFSKAFRHSPEAFVISSIEDGTILEANDTFLRKTGYTDKEIVGRKSSEVGVWADPQERADAVKTLKEKGMVSNKECRFRMKNGETGVWLFSGEIININSKKYMLSVTTDITERKKVEEKLHFSDTALNSLHEGVFALDNEYKITRWNETCEQIFGIKAAEAIGKMANEVIDIVEEYTGQNEKRINLLLQKGFNREEQLYHTPRGNVWVDVHSQEIKSNGKRYGWVTLISDITERKKAEDELRFSHAAFRSIHESVIAMDTKYIITHWNEISEKIYGIKAADAIGKKLTSIIEIEENLPEENERRFKRLEADGYLREEQLHRTKHGDVWVDTSIQSIESDNKRYGWVILSSAITQRKLAEEALKRSEEKYRELIDTSSDGIISTDSQMRFIVWNRGAEKLLGHTEKEMLGQSIMTIVPEKSQKDLSRELIQSKKEDPGKITSRVFETHGLKKDGSLVPIEVSLSTRKSEDKFFITAIMRDITERKLAEEALKRSEEKYRELISTSIDGIISADSQMSVIIWNQGAEKIFGYTEKEMLGQSVFKIIPEKDRAKMGNRVSLLVKTDSREGVNGTLEFVGQRKDGSNIPIEMSLSIRKNEGSHIVTAIVRDVTVRKEAEEKLREIDRMKSEFLSNVSHELRTPLQSISGFTKLIMNGQVPDAATQQEFLQIIDGETQHLGNLINGLLDLSRLESGRFEIYPKPTAIRDTMVESIRSFHTIARDKNITLKEEIPDDLPEMEVDNERMRQVFVNLLSNAIKYSDSGGSIMVRAEKHPEELLFQVSDHGIGMSPEAMQHLFERFYRAKENTARSGTGLGLYITKQIIDAHGGRIWAESKVNEGSTFSFTLPIDVKGGNGHGKKNIDHRRRPSNIKTG